MAANNTINGRTPEEVKKGLKCRERVYLKTCGFVCEECDCFVPPYSVANRYADALALIQQLERERDEARKDLDTINYANTELYSAYDAMKRERDAAVEALRKCNRCPDCVHYYEPLALKIDACGKCFCGNNWQWRGVQ